MDSKKQITYDEFYAQLKIDKGMIFTSIHKNIAYNIIEYKKNFSGFFKFFGFFLNIGNGFVNRRIEYRTDPQ